MSSEAVGNQRRHNPVDSICRKIQTIQRRDQEANPTLQIPKFQSRNYDSPQSNLKKNLEGMLKNRTVKNEKDLLSFGSPAGESLVFQAIPGSSPCKQWSSIAPTPSNATYTISSLTAEKNSKPWPPRSWSQSCSTPSTQTGENYFDFAQYSAYSNAEYRSRFCDKTDSITASPVSYNINLCTPTQRLEGDKSRALVVKRLSMGEGGASRHPAEKRADSYAEVSLICEEDLLDTIFHACDTQRRGKVSVSRIVDYLRHTTSRGSEDSGLEELCNMLDPERRDISIDLPTYHAIMKEWIDDCRNNGSLLHLHAQGIVPLQSENKRRRSALLNVTVGSLEAFGGEVSRGDFGQQSDMKVKVLQEELEEMKVNLNSVEENRVRMVAQNKQMNIRNTMDIDGLQKKIADLCNINANLQLLRNEKNKLENHINMMQPDLASGGMSLSLAYRLNQSIAGSLHTELALAQQSPEATCRERMSPSLCHASSLDETLDREVLLLLQASRHPAEKRADSYAEVSLICEEDLLDTIFHACDTQRRGKVSVSRIVDYLRHTTSRGSEDSGLEELCNMLDPERRDISIDLPTYHAIMKEWIDDCRNNGSLLHLHAQGIVPLQSENKRRRSALLNVTVGSLEAFGGEVSRGDLETSDLVYCVADLQFNNQKLLDQMRKLKLAVEVMEETNNKLLEEKEDFRAQAKSGQQSDMKVKVLQEELEEMKVNLNSVEENRVRMVAQNKQMNIRNTMDIDGLQKKIADLCNINANLQLLRNEKNKLENHINMMQPDLASGGMSLSLAYRLNQSIAGSLHTELALAQQSPERQDFTEDANTIVASLKQVTESQIGNKATGKTRLEALERQLEEKRSFWIENLQQLDQHKSSLENELIKMASNLRRSRTEIIHLKKDLSSRCEVSSVGVQGEEDLSVTSMSEVKETAADQSSVSAVPLKSTYKAYDGTFCFSNRVNVVRVNVYGFDHATSVPSLEGYFTIPLTLIPLCAGDNQSLEVVQRLQKNLDILNQSMTRVSTRAELVGAIHQESSVCKAVEVMIQHVENLKRLYTKEHTELEELKVSSLQNERSFGFNLDKDDLRNKRSPGSQYYKPSSQRRVSIAAIPRNNGGPVHFDLQKLHANAETEANDKLSRRSSTWTLLGVKPNPRPALQRFISSCTWAESGEPSLMKGYNKISSYIADFQSSLSKTNKRLWISLLMVILFAAVIGLIAGFAFQPSAEAAPVGTGDSWMSIQQLLWPYTGLRHNGQPPV
ncbi:Lymphoid-restricted membrane protein [Acipenser ruthenus]|uniref:Lymphoid-restricted membrane protein n=1 Tax=Acipenser ruthenus TaxID=7906 RepID=A0A444UDX2_ACIRT|nr:Lymphoid-restricted membrane protein [Acipenser ruthenus]